MEIKEKHTINYSCGCKHEIALPIHGIFWQATGNNKDCSEHKAKPREAK